MRKIAPPPVITLKILGNRAMPPGSAGMVGNVKLTMKNRALIANVKIAMTHSANICEYPLFLGPGEVDASPGLASSFSVP